MVRGRPLPRLWFLTDRNRVPDPDKILAALPAGSGVVVRDYGYDNRPSLATGLTTIAKARRLVLLVAGDPVLAEAMGADGFHAPERDLPRLKALRIACPHWLITAAAHSPAAIAQAAKGGADAVFVSPVFATASHPDAPHLGVDRLRRIVEQSALPVIALGGVDGETVDQLDGLPLAGIAAIGALANQRPFINPSTSSERTGL